MYSNWLHSTTNYKENVLFIKNVYTLPFYTHEIIKQITSEFQCQSISLPAIHIFLQVVLLFFSVHFGTTVCNNSKKKL